MYTANQAANYWEDFTRPEIDEGGDVFALSLTFIIMMLIMISLMIDDRCSISFAKKDAHVHII